MALSTKISSSFWSDEDVGALTPDQKLAILWVLTNKDMNNAGFLKASRRQFEFDTALTVKSLQGACKVLARSFLCEEQNGSVAILALGYIKYQFSDRALSGKNHIVKHLCGLIRDLPEVFQVAILNRYKDLASPFEAFVSGGSPLQAPYKGHISPQSRAEQSRVEQSTGGAGGARPHGALGAAATAATAAGGNTDGHGQTRTDTGAGSPACGIANARTAEPLYAVEVATHRAEPVESGLLNRPMTQLELTKLARGLIDFLNAQSGATYIAPPEVLGEVAARLEEVHGDVSGVRQMIERQVALWSADPAMRQYLRPSTLFGRKFHDYYGQRAFPAENKKGAPTKAELMALIEQSPANRESVYYRKDCTEEDKRNLKKWRAALAQTA
jgi:uncharacterized phage protein (TIGR02220 family)